MEARGRACQGLGQRTAGAARPDPAPALTGNYRAGDKWVLVLLKVTGVKAHHLRLTLSAPDKLADKMLGESAAASQNHLASESRESSAFLLP